MKTCDDCGEKKRLEEFGKGPPRVDGSRIHLNTCRECCNRRNRERRAGRK